MAWLHKLVNLQKRCCFAGGALISTVVIYGVKLSEGHDYNRFDRELGGHFDWGFYVAIIAAGFSVITFVLLCLTICCMRK